MGLSLVTPDFVPVRKTLATPVACCSPFSPRPSAAQPRRDCASQASALLRSSAPYYTHTQHRTPPCGEKWSFRRHGEVIPQRIYRSVHLAPLRTLLMCSTWASRPSSAFAAMVRTRELRALATAHRIELRVYDLVPNGHHDRITPYVPLRTHSPHEHSPCSWVTTAGDATQAWSYRCCGSTEPRRRRL